VKPTKKLENYHNYIRTYGFMDSAVYWWAKDKEGYTYDITKAGKYSRKEAEEICKNSYLETAYSCTVIDNLKSAHKKIIDFQYLRLEHMAFNLQTLSTIK